MAEGDGAWVVLGRKIDRFQSPSGDPERPQGVPEAGRGAILSFVCVFLKMERELLVVSTNATIPNEQLAGFTMPSASTATQCTSHLATDESQ